jgi:hypothetical protein
LEVLDRFPIDDNTERTVSEQQTETGNREEDPAAPGQQSRPDEKYMYSLQLMKKGTSQPVGLPKGLDEKVILDKLKSLNVGKVDIRCYE